jgi:Tol biopolymer transport system component
MEGRCCTQPFWSPDGRRVLYIDKPAPDLPTGIWALDLTQPQPTPELLIQRIAYYSADFSLRIDLSGNATTIERLAAPLTPGQDTAVTASWEVPANGRPISISPGQVRIAWDVTDEDLEIERRVTQVWVANLDGSDARTVATLPRGGLSGWLSDDVLLLSGRESLRAQEQVLFSLSLVDGRQVELVRSRRLRGGLLSPDRAWLTYYIALDEEKPEENGLWLVRTDGSERRQLERELFGAYQWRDSHRLLIIPFLPEATGHQILELDVETGQTRTLTDPAVTPFKIANGDWRVSPDGRYVVFVASEDRNMWLLTLPE